MNYRDLCIFLSSIPNLGPLRAEKILHAFPSIESLLGARESELRAVSGVNSDIARRVLSFHPKKNEGVLRKCREEDICILTLADEDYPPLLREIYDPPLLLYVKGELKKEDYAALAIVGSRRASFYGAGTAGKIAAELAGRGITVVSGLARGIDTAAHKAALMAGGRTIAVLGSGLLNVYPRENKKLFDEISRQGAVISEFRLDELPLRQNFPRRNRLISGLSRGVIVVEAARHSGALITADFALEQGRDVFAVPGQVNAESSFGTNRLIQQGAKLLMNTDDILEEYALRSETVFPHASGKETRQHSGGADLVLGEQKIYDLLSGEPKHIDELVLLSGMDLSSLWSHLVGLKIHRHVRELPGKNFMKANHG